MKTRHFIRGLVFAALSMVTTVAVATVDRSHTTDYQTTIKLNDHSTLTAATLDDNFGFSAVRKLDDDNGLITVKHRNDASYSDHLIKYSDPTGGAELFQVGLRKNVTYRLIGSWTFPETYGGIKVFKTKRPVP